jgi:hypothetical protein
MTGHRRYLTVAIAGALVLALFAAPAAADVVTRKDPKDTPGRLDIRRVGHGHAGENAVTHTITTYRRFSSRLLIPKRGAFVLVTATPEGEGRIIVIWWRNGRLRAPIFDMETERRVGSAKVSRPNRRAVRVTLEISQLGDLGDPARYRWVALSLFRDKGGCKGEGCVDIAPNRGSILHRLPEPTPEPPPEEVAAAEAGTEEADGISSWIRGLLVSG